MKKIFFFMIIFFFYMVNLSFAPEYSIGVSPAIVDAGELLPGSSKLVKFFIVTSSSEKIYLYLEPMNGEISFFGKKEYNDLIYNSSEENTASWVDVIRSPIELVPKEDAGTIFGSGIKAYREVYFTLNIPKDSEPGYHVFRVRPSPLITSTPAGQVAVQIVALVPVWVIFNVPGNVVRNGEIIGIIPSEIYDSSLPVSVYFKNTGNVTISARVSEAVLHDKDGNIISKSHSSTSLFKPGESKPLTVIFTSENIKPGDYVVSANVSYTTGISSLEQKIKALPPKEKPTYAPPKPVAIPIWIPLILFIIIVCYIIYKKKYEE